MVRKHHDQRKVTMCRKHTQTEKDASSIKHAQIKGLKDSVRPQEQMLEHETSLSFIHLRVAQS